MNPIRPARLDHVVLRVNDVALTQTFYCDVLGCSVDRVREEFGLIQLRAGESLIDLVDVNGPLGIAGGGPPQGDGRNLDHFCLRLDPYDADAIRRHLISKGVEPGDVVSRYGAEGTGPSIYVSDPEGNTVELKGPPEAG